MSSLRITPNLSPRIFPCPRCKETIDTAAVNCPFCSVSIDPKLAEAAADRMARVNQACSDASYLRIMADRCWCFFYCRFFRWLGLLR